MIDYSGLQVCRYLPGRAIVVLMLMHYVDGDLGQYHEYGTNVMVNPPGVEGDAGRGRCSRLAPSSTTCPSTRPSLWKRERTIWGYPKVMADFTIRDGRQFGFDCQHRRPAGGRHGIPPRPAVPSAVHSAQAGVAFTYSHRDGSTLRDPLRDIAGGVLVPAGRCAAPAGRSPYAKELASLGLPKRAMVSSSADNVEMTFGDAKEIS